MLSRLFKFLKVPNSGSTEASGEASTEPARSEMATGSLSNDDPNTQADSSVGNEANETATPSFMICREALLDKSNRVAGYSFSLNRSVGSRVRNSSELVQLLYDDVLIENIIRMDVRRLTGQRLIFIPLLPASLERPPLSRLESKGVVLVITDIGELLTKEEAYLKKIRSLKNEGFRIGVQGDLSNIYLKKFLDVSDFVFIDIGEITLPVIKSTVEGIVTQSSGKSIVASNIRALEEFHVCSKLPFHYFHGTFVSSRETWTAPSMSEGRVKILRLLNLIRQDADTSELVQAFKLDPALSFKILRYLNSPGMGFGTKVNTIDQALLLIGRQNLYRWLTLLLFTSTSDGTLDLALMENALIRARLAELSAREDLPKNERDELFVAGIFSLLDILLRMPIETVLKQVNLPSQVEEALLNKSGKYSPYLELAIACEESDQERIEMLSSRIGLTLPEINSLQTEAMVWADLINQ